MVAYAEVQGTVHSDGPMEVMVEREYKGVKTHQTLHFEGYIVLYVKLV